MRIWDIDPGFLNDKSLLGEHRELHGIISIYSNNKKGYSRHPETLRWRDAMSGLAIRHQLLAAEMQLRGFNHWSPLTGNNRVAEWPESYINPPGEQYEILGRKYQDRLPGRIPLPRNCMELWARHKYSVMARDYNAYRRYGPAIAAGQVEFGRLALELVEWLRRPPSRKSLDNALLHMWGYCSGLRENNPEMVTFSRRIAEIQGATMKADGPDYLRNSTALGELAYWSAEVDKLSIS